MIHFSGIANNTATLLQNEFLCNKKLWHSFAEVFHTQPDGENNGWRGEYWGKMMRGACLIYEYTQNKELYAALEDSIRHMLTAAEGDGRVSSYSRNTEFNGWDLWGRKYVMLGCEYYLDICKDQGLRNDVIRFLCRCADYILEHIGQDKKKITKASFHWYGINSTSILEPMVKLYRITKEPRYLDFATYIVETGGAEGINIFKLAYENKLLPYQYGVSKAYELTSCFEGLLEYYYETGIEQHKTAVINFAEALLLSELSIIGGSGCTHELFDHTATRQTVKYDGVMQETCVTVTLMKFFSRLLSLTRDKRYADAIEKSFYNAYLGAVNTQRRESVYMHTEYPDKSIKNCILPFDSYSPLTAGRRGRVVGGAQLLADGSYFGCCACIGAAGVGVLLKNAVLVDDDSITISFYESGNINLIFNGTPVSIEIQTKYPLDGQITLNINTESPVEFKLLLRNPQWAKMEQEYTVYKRIWHKDTVKIGFDMPIELHFPEKWDEDTIYTEISWDSGYCGVVPTRVYHNPLDDCYFAVTRGPLTLAADSRSGKPADSIFSIPQEYEYCENEIYMGVPCLLKLKLKPKNGDEFYLVDYASAGQDWESLIAAWLMTN